MSSSTASPPLAQQQQDTEHHKVVTINKVLAGQDSHEATGTATHAQTSASAAPVSCAVPVPSMDGSASWDESSQVTSISDAEVVVEEDEDLNEDETAKLHCIESYENARMQERDTGTLISNFIYSFIGLLVGIVTLSYVDC